MGSVVISGVLILQPGDEDPGGNRIFPESSLQHGFCSIGGSGLESKADDSINSGGKLSAKMVNLAKACSGNSYSHWSIRSS